MRQGFETTSFRPILLFPILAVLVAGFLIFQAGQKTKSGYTPSTAREVTPLLERPQPTSALDSSTQGTPTKTQAPLPPTLANLGLLPDWSTLEKYQKTITRHTFTERLRGVYTKLGGYEEWITIHQKHAEIRHRDGVFTLKFSDENAEPSGSIWNWKTKEILPHAEESPLLGYHIALDPGHIGGNFSMIEGRHLEYGNHAPIQEGSMTLLTAQHLKSLLEELGARVTLVRDQNEPVTPTRPSDYTKGRSKQFAEKLFYRTAEIRARAELVNHNIQPDLVVCLHFNATGSPVPIPGQDFHILLNGAYHPGELSHEDERFQMLQRLLSGTIEEEVPIAKSVADSFVAYTELPPYEYRPDHPYSVKIADFIFARNLLANRLYQCPVIFLEPYTMNSTEFIKRHKAGDYEGYKNVDGKPRLSVYREYAQAVADGLASYYSQKSQ